MTQYIKIPAWGFLKTIIAMAWECIRYPFYDSYIDMTTGKVINRVYRGF